MDALSDNEPPIRRHRCHHHCRCCLARDALVVIVVVIVMVVVVVVFITLLYNIKWETVGEIRGEIRGGTKIAPRYVSSH